MADEITVYVSLKVTNGNLSFNKTTSQLKFDQAVAEGPAPGFITVGTTEETVDLSELTTLGWCTIENLDPTNYIEFGFSTGVYGIRVEPGEVCCFRLNPGATVYARANTAACGCVFNGMGD